MSSIQISVASSELCADSRGLNAVSLAKALEIGKRTVQIDMSGRMALEEPDLEPLWTQTGSI